MPTWSHHLPWPRCNASELAHVKCYARGAPAVFLSRSPGTNWPLEVHYSESTIACYFRSKPLLPFSLSLLSFNSSFLVFVNPPLSFLLLPSFSVAPSLADLWEFSSSLSFFRPSLLFFLLLCKFCAFGLFLGCAIPMQWKAATEMEVERRGA